MKILIVKRIVYFCLTTPLSPPEVSVSPKPIMKYFEMKSPHSLLSSPAKELPELISYLFFQYFCNNVNLLFFFSMMLFFGDFSFLLIHFSNYHMKQKEMTTNSSKIHWGFSGWLNGKKYACQWDTGSIPGLGRPHMPQSN